jgi:hypothetical protein
MTPDPHPTAEALAIAPVLLSGAYQLRRLRSTVSEWSGAFEAAYLRHPAVRWIAKAVLDLACGAGAVLLASASTAAARVFGPVDRHARHRRRPAPGARPGRAAATA